MNTQKYSGIKEKKYKRFKKNPTLMHHECKGSNSPAKKAKHDTV